MSDEKPTARKPEVEGRQASADAPIIEIIGMHKWFGDFHVLKGIDLSIAEKERIVQALESCQWNKTRAADMIRLR